MSGMNVFNPTLMTNDTYATSRHSTDIMVRAIKGDGEYEIEANIRHQREIKTEALLKKKSNKSRNIMPSLLASIVHVRGQSNVPERIRHHHD